MSDTMTIEDYLAQGGVLTSPANVPPRYRGELLRLMATFVDSELAASAGFADTINAAPGITARIAAARITLEKADHAERVLRIMGDFGADQARYAVHHPWAERLPREVELAAYRIVQEAITNVVKHAQARECHVHLTHLPDRLLVEVEDDGIGFRGDTETVSSDRGLGLVSVRERAARLGGTFNILSAPGQGTRLVVSLPDRGLLA